MIEDTQMKDSNCVAVKLLRALLLSVQASALKSPAVHEEGEAVFPQLLDL